MAVETPAVSGSIADLGVTPTVGIRKRRKKRPKIISLSTDVLEQAFEKPITVFLGISSSQYTPKMRGEKANLGTNNKYGATITNDPFSAWRFALGTVESVGRGKPIVLVLTNVLLKGKKVSISMAKSPEITQEKAFQYFGIIPSESISAVIASSNKLAFFTRTK